MSTLTITPSYVSLDTLFEADLDSIRTPLQNFLNSTQLDGTNIADGSLDAAHLQTAVQQVAVQTGMILEFYGTALPTGYLWCNGESYTTNSQPQLYGVIANTYGGSPGVNFLVPDKRDRVTIGRDNMNGSAASRITIGGSGLAGDTIGAVGGRQDLSSHTHAVGSATVTSNSHIHVLTDPGHAHVIERASTSGPTTTGWSTDITVGNQGTVLGKTNTAATDLRTAGVSYDTTGSTHTHSGGGAGTSGASGTKTEQSVVQPSIVCNFIIKA